MSKNPYADACKRIENILLAMGDEHLVRLMTSIDEFSGAFDGRFRTMTIGDVVCDTFGDRTDLADACLAIGATDYEDLVRKTPEGWESGKAEDMVDDAKLYADDAAEWLLDHDGDIEFLWWTNEAAPEIIKRICDEYWEGVMEDEPAA